jgi:PKD repeat protein
MAQKKKGKGTKKAKKKSKKIETVDNRMKIIAILVIAIVIIAIVAFLLLGGDDNGNGGNGNGNQKPIADFEYTPAIIYVNDTVNFDASNSTDLDEDALEYTWDFGDVHADSGNPNTDSGKTASHIYTEVGDYTVTLVVYDGDKQDIKEENITVLSEENPTVSVTIVHINNIQSNIMWSITVTAVEGTNEQLDLSNIRFNFYNGSDTNDVKLTGILSNLGVTNKNPLNPHNDDGIYFDDSNSDSTLSVGDFLSVAGDGGASIQSGDYFQLIYNPNQIEMMNAQPL